MFDRSAGVTWEAALELLSWKEEGGWATAKGEKEALCESTTAEPSVKKAACRTIEEVDGWSLETALDIETAHAICRNCRIILVEADEGEEAPLEAAEATTVPPDG